jgi:hypothetical protein
MSPDVELALLMGGAEFLLRWADRLLVEGGSHSEMVSWEARVRAWRADIERAFKPSADGLPAFLKKQAG